ncbi:phosphotransferase-like protein [Brachybacterium sacelli]|uniref:Chloramphenicol 3-O-phosphotransferase/SAM-dependent methyltransferase n=1 Tax=Brachybacterium sacelli TaxID=173364 RepID=A0ABS4WY89_9MICO|nr:chloramphenicol 3-O-phosphotransferase/SAM-dependent methyltransferase [Brachybacterium sacelli]
MTTPRALTPLVLIGGPIAAGKSAVSRLLADALRADGRQLALVELDAIADMARPTLPDWTVAHRIFASVTGQWLEAGAEVVIAESVSDREELARVLRNVPAGTPVLTVVVTCPFGTALERALADPTRGISRDPEFLYEVHAQWAGEMPLISADLVLDTSTLSLEESVRRIRAALESLPQNAVAPANIHRHPGRMRPADELITEAATADVDGWGFAFLDDRAFEERPPWGYSGQLAEAVATADVAIDLDTGGGEVLAECPRLAAQQHVTEGWAPNAERARLLLGPRGVQVHETPAGAPLPLPGGAADLVTARHPVSPDWAEIVRVLAPGGEYLAQHVGPASAFELIEHFIGPTTEQQRRGRHPDDEVAAAEAAGLEVTELRTARLRMEFLDVGAVVWILRKCVWWVPDFEVDRYHERLLAMDAIIRRDGRFVAHSTRHLIRARH